MGHRRRYAAGSPYGTSTDAVNCAALDTEGNVWLASSNEGLIRYSPGCFASPNLAAGLTDMDINAVTAAGGRYYAAVNQGLLAFDSDWQPVSNKLTQALAGVHVQSLMTDSRGRLWCGTYSELGLVRYDTGSGELTFFNQSNGLGSTRIRVAFELRDGTVAVGTQDGLALIRGDGVAAFYDKDSGVETQSILCIVQAPDGTLLAGSAGSGIYALAQDGSIFDLYERDGKLWLLQDSGIYALDKARILAGETPHAIDYGKAKTYTVGSWLEVWMENYAKVKLQTVHLQNQPRLSEKPHQAADRQYSVGGSHFSGLAAVLQTPAGRWSGRPCRGQEKAERFGTENRAKHPSDDRLGVQPRHGAAPCHEKSNAGLRPAESRTQGNENADCRPTRRLLPRGQGQRRVRALLPRPRHRTSPWGTAGAKVDGHRPRPWHTENPTGHFPAKRQSGRSPTENEKRLPHTAPVGSAIAAF